MFHIPTHLNDRRAAVGRLERTHRDRIHRGGEQVGRAGADISIAGNPMIVSSSCTWIMDESPSGILAVSVNGA